MKWISVKDELPKNDNEVLGYCRISNYKYDCDTIIQVYFDCEKGWEPCQILKKMEDFDINVKFWCPIPSELDEPAYDE